MELRVVGFLGYVTQGPLTCYAMLKGVLGSESWTVGLLVSPAIDPKKKKSHPKITIFRGKFAYILVGFGLDKHNSHPDKGYTTNCTHNKISVFEILKTPSGASDNNSGGSSLPLCTCG